MFLLEGIFYTIWCPKINTENFKATIFCVMGVLKWQHKPSRTNTVGLKNFWWNFTKDIGLLRGRRLNNGSQDKKSQPAIMREYVFFKWKTADFKMVKRWNLFA